MPLLRENTDDRPAVAQREGEAPQLSFFAIDMYCAQTMPGHLGRLPGGGSNRRTATVPRSFSLRPQPVGLQGVSGRVIPLAQLPHQHSRVPHGGLHALLQIPFELVQLARLFGARPIHRNPFGMDWI